MHCHMNWRILYLYVTPNSLVESYERYWETCATNINVCIPVDGVSNIVCNVGTLRSVGTSRTTELLTDTTVRSSNTIRCLMTIFTEFHEINFYSLTFELKTIL